MDWKKYIDGKLIAQHEDGFLVVKPENYSESSKPLFCPVCDGIMRSSYDEEAYDKYECCDSCANKWVYRDVEKWKSGWRPGNS